ncbi:MAG: alpha/beta hydrolase [Paracoccus sp. (in: a-proteobacteria)]|uniref:alpha/beta fold hydrolase n=1 Tax=Paracoccus sp. TaxID=267 RepID=UPI0026E0A0FD|nr:alpha/beta hydrolase [Paracoccus sp. (in: a-proteobacteria)]MDO5614137.1 alpha/beta hydrolase [Paracoccus sp. (in: a-proteobacteria)]
MATGPLTGGPGIEAAPFHQLPGETLPPAQAFWVRADDGIRLRLAVWNQTATAGTVLLFPGRTEYIEKYAPVAAELSARGYATLAIDWRGQGMADRLLPNSRAGHVGAFADYQRDVVEMILAATDLQLPRPWHLLAHSMGGCIGLAALMNDLPVASAVFSAPMWGINLGQIPRGMALGIAYMAGRLGRGSQAAPGSGAAAGCYVLDESFSANLLTTDTGEWCRLLQEASAWPDLTLGGASFDWVAGALNECSRLAALPSPQLPVLVSLGGAEKIVSASAIRDRCARWTGAQLLETPGARHEIMIEAAPLRDRFLTAATDLFAAAS